MDINGIMPAVLTPFTSSGAVDCTAMERLIARLYAADVDGLYVCGQTGEGLAQSVKMRKAALETAAEREIQPIPVIDTLDLLVLRKPS